LRWAKPLFDDGHEQINTNCRFELQRTVVSCPLTRITENSIGFSDLPELPYTGRITDMEVRMVRLGCFAERFSEALIVGIWTNIADQSVFIVTL